MANLSRGASLTGYVELARAAGLDPFPLLAACGLPAAALADPDLPINADAFARLLEATAAASGWDDVGLRLAETRELANLGPLGLMLRDQPTVGDAVAAVARYIPLQTEPLRLETELVGELALLKLGLAGGGRPLRQGAELVVGVTFRAFRTLLGEAWRPVMVGFQHGPPRDPARHRQVFGCPVEFGHDFDGLAIHATELSRPIPHADPEMARQMRRYLDGLLDRPNAAAADQVRELAAALLPMGLCTLDRVARHLGLDPRTLQRRLAREGRAFAAVVDDLRAELAIRHLRDGDRSLTEMADILGFSALSAFSRWFRGRFGRSPRAWRQSHAATRS